MRINPDFHQKLFSIIFSISIVIVQPQSSPYRDLTEPRDSTSLVLPFSCDELFNQGASLFSMGQYQEALNLYFQALDCYRSSGPENSMAELGEIDSLMAIAELYSFLGLQKNALLHYQEARSLIEANDYIYDEEDIYEISIPDRVVKYQYVQILTKIEALLVATGDYEGAINNFDIAATALDELGPDDWWKENPGNIQTTYYLINKSLEAELLLSKSSAYYALGQYEDSLQSAEKSYETWLEVGDVANVLREIYRELGLLDDPDSPILQSLRGQALALNVIGASQAALGRQDEAIGTLTTATDLWRTARDKTGEARNLYLIGNIYDSLNQDDSALTYYMDAITRLEEVQNTISIDEFTSGLAGEYSFVYESAIQILVESSRYKEAFYYVEKAKARALINQFTRNSLTLDTELSPAALEEVRSLQNQIAEIRKEIFTAENNNSETNLADKIKKLNAELSDSEKKYADLLTRLKLDNLQADSLTGINVSSVEEIQRFLDPDTTLVEYFILPEEMVIFVISAEGFNVSTVSIDKTALVNSILSFRNFATLNEDFPDSLVNLHQWLISPIEQYLHTPNLIIVPHGILHYLPFAALTDGHSYLVDQFVITTMPSASVFRYIPGKAVPEKDSILAVGNPTTLLSNLPYAEREASLIGQLFKSEPLIGDNATETTIKEMLPDATIVHLAAHGEYNPGNPLFSSINLAVDEGNDGRLEVHEIYNLTLNPDLQLVVLSGCQTNVGEVSAGDDVVGLTRAFIYSGAPTVVSSLWIVDDESTAYLMQRFYKHLLEGTGKSQALQQAQLETRTRYPNPYYWAAFVINGDSGKATLQTQGSWFRNMIAGGWPWIVSMLFVSVCAIWLIGARSKHKRRGLEIMSDT